MDRPGRRQRGRGGECGRTVAPAAEEEVWGLCDDESSDEGAEDDGRGRLPAGCHQ
jgi:hypothetical protein